MFISILTLFPDMFRGPLDLSIAKRAQTKGLLHIDLVNIRDFASGSYKSVDDHPYGGGAGMILRVDVLDRALESVKQKAKSHVRSSHTILLDPQGNTYTQQKAKELTLVEHLILICGHYEGVDQRVRSLVDEELSIGDYVLSGGEIPALVLVDSVTRLLPGVLSKASATKEESFTEPLLEYPQYTRPEQYKGMNVPDVLLSGNHAQITNWRREQSKTRTAVRRPDLLRGKRIGLHGSSDKGGRKLGGHR
ncbi:tRNA (guanosine(37)-N1)-methyltransferase TrmD [Candidatus Gottesmanbacteria bacterium]|nr:tRNA (guanosine(37)-N1)-methyltransferase TrmD [Candidatus Gottesmanbacteria bacterium]